MKVNLEQIQTWLDREITPFANEIDRSPQSLQIALQKMSDLSLLALKVPTELGGSSWSELDYRRLQVMMARTSGALTFLQTQHQSAAVMLAKSDNQELKQKLLPYMATGKVLIGVGFSHLRRQGIPMVAAREVSSGYEITGEVPWITGYNFLDRFILGATLEDGRELYGILPLKTVLGDEKGGITVSLPMKLMAIASSNTVSAKIDRWHLEKDSIVSIKPAGSIHQSSRHNILNHGWYALGCAYAGLDILSSLAAKKQLDFLEIAWQNLDREVKQAEQLALNLATKDSIHYQEKLELRGHLINLASRCAQAAIIASSGAANYLETNAARVYREALLFAVSGQTEDVMEISIRKLLNFDYLGV